MGRAARRDWSEEEDELLRHHALLKTPFEVVADMLGTTRAAVQTRTSRLGGSQVLSRFQKERIVELHREGWRLSRLAKQIGTTEDIAAVVLRQAGYDVVSANVGPEVVPAPRKKHAPAFHFTAEQTEAIGTRMLAGERPIAIAADLGIPYPVVRAKAAAMGLKFRDIAEQRAAAGLSAPVVERIDHEEEDDMPATSKAGVWDESEISGLDKLFSEKKDPREIARILGRGIRDVEAQIAAIPHRDRHGGSDRAMHYAPGATRSRVLELHASGATSSRIAKQVPMTVRAIDDLLERAGLKPNVVPKRGGGRYGVDIPLPPPCNLDAEPLKLILPSQVAPPAPVDEIVEPEADVVHAATETPVEKAPEPDEIPAAEPEVVQQPQSQPEQEIAMPAVATEQNPFGRPWSAEDLAYLAAADAEGKGLAEIAAHLGRTVSSIKKKRSLSRGKRIGAKTVAAPALVSALDAEIAVVEGRIAAEQRALKLMRDLRGTLDGARAA